MKIKLFKLNSLTKALLLCSGMAAWPLAGFAQTSFTINNSSADALLANGTNGNLANLNFGSAGTLAIAPAESAKGAMASVLQFNTATAVSQFNSTYGAGNWQLTGLTLMFASNFGTQGAVPNNNIFNNINAGSFGIDWLQSDSWAEGNGGGNGANNGAVSYNSIPGLLAAGFDSLGNYTYTPPGNNIYSSYSLSLDGGLVSDAAAGGAVSFYLYAADNQVSYLLNSREFASNHPTFVLTAAPVPEPGSAPLLAAGLAAWLWMQQKRAA